MSTRQCRQPFGQKTCTGIVRRKCLLQSPDTNYDQIHKTEILGKWTISIFFYLCKGKRLYNANLLFHHLKENAYIFTIYMILGRWQCLVVPLSYVNSNALNLICVANGLILEKIAALVKLRSIKSLSF